MKRFAMLLVIPLVVIAGAIFANPSQVEAGRWHWRSHVHYAPRHAVYVEHYRPYRGYYWAAPSVSVRVHRPTVVYGPAYGYYTARPYVTYYGGPYYHGYWW